MPEQRPLDGNPAAPATDRLFFAVYPDAATAARIAALTEDLRGDLELAGKASDEQRLHATLQFLGSHPGLPAPLVDAAAALASTVDAAAFDVAFDRVGSFPGKAARRPIVLLGDAGVVGLKALRRALRSRLAAGGCPPPREAAYVPHVTLLYDRRAIAERPVEPVRWRVREFRLMHSRVGQGKHVTLGHWQLRD